MGAIGRKYVHSTFLDPIFNQQNGTRVVDDCLKVQTEFQLACVDLSYRNGELSKPTTLAGLIDFCSHVKTQDQVLCLGRGFLETGETFRNILDTCLEAV